MTFLDRAQATVAKGAPVIRLRPRTKIAMDSDWPSLATTDPETLQKWNTETPDANCAAVAQAREGGVWFFEIDDPSVPVRIETETGQKIPLTYRVRSRNGRGHYYWRQSAESIAMGNVAQNYVKNGDFSVRVDNEYVVAAGSIHPISNEPYQVVCTAAIIECPQWLIDWIKAQRTSSRRFPRVGCKCLLLPARCDGDCKRCYIAWSRADREEWGPRQRMRLSASWTCAGL